MKDITAKLDIKPGSKPKCCKVRSVPYAIRAKVETALKELVTRGVIVPWAMDQVLSGLAGVQCYLDDILVTGKTEAEHLSNLDSTLQRLKQYGLRVKESPTETQQTTTTVDHGGESRITTGLKKWVCFLTLDPNTANKHLFLSEGNRKVINVDKNQSYPDHPDRFDHVFNPQVLCRESVCGRCYWEIECSGHVYISVSYKSISRKGRADECRFGCNDQSWSLFCSRSRYSFRHNKIVTDLPVKSISRRIGVYDDNISRIGVYVDVSAGTLSFYSVSDTMSLIHTVQTTFTQPLYPGFGFNFLDFGSSVKLC
ncbi:stonustoxin subunit beta [Labeo rohita]|uniref:stonustoxin subunit beta n=1 Tax=Labeo rohita TaxID=84645 RepID=UPI0021E27244|nr:stonustoxin subunit beta [Labeo rohita]